MVSPSTGAGWRKSRHSQKGLAQAAPRPQFQTPVGRSSTRLAVGVARCNVATPSHFRFFTKRSRSSSLDLAPTQSCEPSNPSACRFETVGASSGSPPEAVVPQISTRAAAGFAGRISKLRCWSPASINRIDFGERLLRRRRIRLPRRLRCRARYGSYLDGVATLQCLGWTIDHLVRRR
jgi:hypothetical protein